MLVSFVVAIIISVAFDFIDVHCGGIFVFGKYFHKSVENNVNLVSGGVKFGAGVAVQQLQRGFAVDVYIYEVGDGRDG